MFSDIFRPSLAFCNLDTIDITDALSMIADNSYRSFNWKIAGICMRFRVSTRSFSIP